MARVLTVCALPAWGVGRGDLATVSWLWGGSRRSGVGGLVVALFVVM
jgi:hypothetical protein